MGEAKRNRAALQQAALVDIERFMHQPSEDEAAHLAYIEALPRKLIPRAPDEAIRYMRMQPQQCHVNCLAYCDLDPEKKSRVVSGWWVRGDVYVFHSVVGRDGGMSCVTPYTAGDPEPTLEFIPDPRVIWEKEPDGRHKATIDGADIPYAVRKDPARTIAECEYVKARLEAGVHPYQAMDLEGFVWPRPQSET